MDRGIPQQMLAEMDLRDMNRPSVLFHGFANESTGESERASALNTLRALDRRIDGTRLTGQAAYGINPSDPTSANLDVAGYTMYYGVLYGGRLSGVAVQSALQEAHRTYPHKPIVVLEYGHWADDTGDEAQQLRVFNAYYAQLSAAFDIQQNGFVGAAVWWTLDDYWTQRPGLTVENFGLFRPDGSMRPAAQAASRDFRRRDHRVCLWLVRRRHAGGADQLVCRSHRRLAGAAGLQPRRDPAAPAPGRPGQVARVRL